MATYGNPETGASIEIERVETGIDVTLWRDMDVVAQRRDLASIEDVRAYVRGLPSDQELGDRADPAMGMCAALAPQVGADGEVSWTWVGPGETEAGWFEQVDEPYPVAKAFIRVEDMAA